MHANSLPIILSFAASDPTGGAGIQSDVATCLALGAHAVTVITALTAQDSHGVSAVWPVSPDQLRQQTMCIFEDMLIDIFKLSVLGSEENVLAISDMLLSFPNIPLIFDPVLFSGRGDPLMPLSALATIKDHILPKTFLLTPNTEELRLLSGLHSSAPVSACIDVLIKQGVKYILLTGTHDTSTPQVINTLWSAEGLLQSNSWARLPNSYHGSGCTLAAALAAELAGGANILDAVLAAQDYTWNCLASAMHLGKGQLFPDRLFWARCTEDDLECLDENKHTHN